MSAENSGDWRWVRKNVVFAVHDRQLAEHGGADGIRDEGAVDSALARAVNRAAYEHPDAAELAAAYIFGLTKNHGFVDGNKRTAWIAGRLFLADNGYSLEFESLDAIRLVEGVAAGRIDEVKLGEWIRSRLSAAAADPYRSPPRSPTSAKS